MLPGTSVPVRSGPPAAVAVTVPPTGSPPAVTATCSSSSAVGTLDARTFTAVCEAAGVTVKPACAVDGANPSLPG